VRAALILIVVLALTFAAVDAQAADLPQNLALGRPYTLSPAPNYGLCTDAGDKVQLTDGKHAGPEMFWGQPAAVGWAASNPVQIIVDLGAVESIGGVAFSTASRLNAGVKWPTIIVGVSDDGATYHIAGQLAATPIANQDSAREYRQTLRLTGLRTRGRFVMFFALPGGSYVFCDEVEVLKGSHNAQQAELTGRTLTAADFRDCVAFERRRAWLAAQCRQLADRAHAESRSAARTQELRRGLREVEAELRSCAERFEGFSLDPSRLRDAQRQVAYLCAQANAALRPGRSYFVWEHDPWAPLSRYEIPPRGQPALQRLEIHAASNEYSSAAVTVTNLTRVPLRLRARIEDLRGEQASIGAGDIRLRRVEFVETVGNEVVADALPLLDDSGLRLGPGETSQIWLTLPKRRLAPGDYRGCLVVQTSRGASGEGERPEAPVAVEILLRVYPVELPDEMNLQTYNWAYVTTFPLVRGLERQAVSDLFAHYTNTFVFCGADVPWPRFNEAPGGQEPTGAKGTIDFSAHDRNLELHRGAREVSWFWGFSDSEHPDGGCFGAQYLSPQWKERFAWWLRAWVAHLKELGYDYGDFFMYPFDETLCDRFRDLAQLIKEVDPAVRIFADPVVHDTRERIAAIAPYIDIWCPHLFTFEQRPADLQFIRDRAHKLWTYVCSGPAKALPPHRYYRLMMWKAFQHGFTGCGFWAYADAGWSGDDAWDDFDGTHPDFTVIYTARNAPPGVPRSEAIIPSKRWEAWREGIEDYELMRLAAAAARGADADGQRERAAALRAGLQAAIEAALASPDDAAAVEGSRRRLLAAFRP
jgi:hypothetical protein